MKRVKYQAINQALLKEAGVTAWRKLTPVNAIRNPVMFVVWIGTLISAVITLQRIFSGNLFAFELASSVILLFTVWFANFAEAIAEARGRGQAASLRYSGQPPLLADAGSIRHLPAVAAQSMR